MEKKLDVKINQSIISVLGKKLYSSEYSMVVLRELLQNSLDANSSQIDITFQDNILTVRDNGTGIQKIEGLLDTIGESSKPGNGQTIGGYGLAKLAIFGVKDWKFLSTSGSFSSGYIFDDNETIVSGTIVRCEFEEEDITWGFGSKIRDYCSLVNRNCDFTYNDEPISKLELEEFSIGSEIENICHSHSYQGQGLIRLNGLPTFQQWISNLNGTIVFDYQTTASPYDDNYPLTSNRDSFIHSSNEYLNLSQRIKDITTKLETDKLLEENKKVNLNSLIWRNKKYFTVGNVDKFDFNDNSMLITTYERYITQIDESLHNPINEDIFFGLRDGTDDTKASYVPAEKCFTIEKGLSNKGEILALALHEFTHFLGYGTYGHDQSFSSKVDEITGKVIGDIFNGKFRK